MVCLLPKKDMMANIYILFYKINPLWISGFFHGWSLREKCPNTEFFPIFSPKTGKYEPEKTPYLDTFHTVGVGSIPVT